MSNRKSYIFTDFALLPLTIAAQLCYLWLLPGLVVILEFTN